MALKVKATSSAVTGSPSCHLMPSFRVKVRVFWSSDMVYSAMLGTTLSFLS